MPQENINEIRKIIKLLKINDLSVMIGRTSHGDLMYKVPSEGEAHFTLDAVPVEKEVQDELQKIVSEF